MQQMPYKPVAQELAQYGRYGDSMLVHMNPVEVAGLASLSPTGKLTTNPVTGQPEAFLPFLAPILGSVLGTSFLPGLASAAGLGGLGATLAASPALAGAIGSGIATTLETGSLEKGLVSGLTGFGLGKALGAAGDLATGAEPIAALGGATDPGAAAVAEMATSMGAEATAPSLTEALRAGTSNLGQMISDPGAIGSALMKPGTLIPAGIGINQMETERLQEEMKNLDIARRQQREADYARAQAQMEAAMYPNLEYPDLPGMTRYGMNGGIVDMLPSRRMQEGGSTSEENPTQPPPGYRPGIDPEFLYTFAGAPQAGRFGGTIIGTGDSAVEQFTVPGLTGTFGDLNPYGDPFVPGITTGFGTNIMADPLVGSGTTRAEIINEVMSGSFGSTGDRGMRTGIEGDRFGRPLSAEMAYRAGAPQEAVDRLIEQEDARRRAGQQGYAPEGRVVAPPTEEQLQDFQERQAAVAAGDTSAYLGDEARQRLDSYNQSKANLGAFLRGEITADDVAPAVPVEQPAVADTAPRFAGGSPTFQETTNIAFAPQPVVTQPAAPAPAPVDISERQDLLSRNVLGMAAESITPDMRFDVNNDGSLDIRDAIQIRKGDFSEDLYNIDIAGGMQSLPQPAPAAPVAAPPAAPAPQAQGLGSLKAPSERAEPAIAPAVAAPVQAVAPQPMPAYQPPPAVAAPVAPPPQAVAPLPVQTTPPVVDSEGIGAVIDLPPVRVPTNEEEKAQAAEERRQIIAEQNRNRERLEAEQREVEAQKARDAEARRQLIAEQNRIREERDAERLRLINEQDEQLRLLREEREAEAQRQEQARVENVRQAAPAAAPVSTPAPSVVDQIATGGIGDIPVEKELADSITALTAPAQTVQPTQAVQPQEPFVFQMSPEARQEAARKYNAFLNSGLGRFAGRGVGPRVSLQEGGMTEAPNQLVEMTVMAIRGELPNGADEVVAQFIQAYGNDAFMQLREQVLQEVVPGAQTQGLIRGQGGGMDDEVMGMIGSSQPVAVSPGEYIVPADAVSGLGDGSSDAGAARLDQLVENVRRARTGTAKQPAPIKESMGGKV